MNHVFPNSIRLLIVLGATVMLSSGCKTTSPTAPSEGTHPIDSSRYFARLTGIVTNASTNAVIDQATITLAGNTIYSDATGRYRFDSVRIGADSMDVTKAGYFPQAFQIQIDSGAVLSRNVALVPYPPVCTIKIHVADADTKQPIAGALVFLSPGYTSFDSLTTVTGDVVIKNAYPETYAVTATAQGYGAGSVQVKPNAGDTISATIQLSTRPKLVAFYRLSNNTVDSSGNGNDGTMLGGGYCPDRFGTPNSAYEFQTWQDAIKVPNAFDLNFDSKTSYTVCFWYRSLQPSAKNSPWTKYISKGSGTTEYNFLGWEFRINAPIQPYEATLGTSQAILGVFLFPKSDSLWHFVTLQVDRTGTGVFSGWVDGLLNNSSKNAAVLLGDITGDPLLIGPGETATTPAHGMVDDVRIYSGLLSKDDIQSLYHEGGWK